MSEPLEPRRRTSPGMVAAIVVAVVLLAGIGGTAGYFAAGDPRNTAANTTSTPPVDPGSPTAQQSAPSTPTAEPSTAGPTTSPSAGTFALPNLVGQDFEAARRKVRELGLGWRLIFGPSGDSKAIGSSTPRAGSPVRRGVTITLYVRGVAPEATIPGVMGVPCAQAASIIVDHGLYPQYPTGRNGTVIKQEPEAGGGVELKWNDQMKIHCSTATASPSAYP